MKKACDHKWLGTWFQIFLAFSCVAFAQPAFSQEEAERDTDENRAKKSPAVDRLISDTSSSNSLKILFIGNSLLYGGDVPGVFLGMLKARDSQAAIKMREVVGGNYTLKNHIERGTAVNAIDNEGPWDYVVLQEQSSHLGNEVAKSIDETKPLAARILRNHGRVLVFDAWTQLIAPDYAELSRSNAQLAQSLGAQRVSVLTALAQANAVSGMKLFKQDGHHLEPEGVYLAGCLLYAQIMRRSPVGMPNKLYVDDALVCDIDFNHAKTLQTIAANCAR